MRAVRLQAMIATPKRPSMLMPMGGQIERYFVPVVVGLAPVIFALVTWPSGNPTPFRLIALQTALPVAAAELFVIILAFREGILRYVRDNRLPRLAVAALATWIAVGVATSLFVSPIPAIAVRWTVLWIIHLLFGISVAYLCTRNMRPGDFVICYLFGFLLYSLIFLAYVIGNWSRPIDWVHYLPGAIHIRHVAIYAAAMTGLSLGAMAAVRSRFGLALAISLATIGFGLGLWTGARGMILSVIGATVLAAALVPAMRTLRVLGSAALGLGIALAATAWLPVPNAQMMGVARQVAATTEREMTTGRLQIWSNVLDAIGRNPIFGYGPGQMPAVAPFYSMGQPHNLVLQVLLDWGLVGFACVVVASFYYLRRAIPVVREEGELLAAPATAMLSLLLLSMLDAAMFHVLPLSIFAACAGMIASRWLPRPSA